MIKKALISAIAVCLLFGGVVFAADNSEPKQPDTVVGAEQLLNNRFQYVDPQNKETEAPEEVQRLKDQGVFTAVEDARQAQTAAPKSVK